MNIKYDKSKTILTDVPDFNLIKSFECGQCFRWNRDESGVYTGVAYGRTLSLRQDAEGIIFYCAEREFKTLWYDYFDLDRNYAEIRGALCISDFMKQATEHGKGIRILRQEPWEALCSFIFSQNNNIPRIKSIVENFCRFFGKPLGNDLHAFPLPETVAALRDNDLAPLRSGYRAGYVIAAARAVCDSTVDFDALAKSAPAEARETLKQIRGVGDKVADCTLLFGLHMLDTFPVDVWMKKALSLYFPAGFAPSDFSPYAGIAQQYIFHYIRNRS